MLKRSNGACSASITTKSKLREPIISMACTVGVLIKGANKPLTAEEAFAKARGDGIAHGWMIRNSRAYKRAG